MLEDSRLSHVVVGLLKHTPAPFFPGMLGWLEPVGHVHATEKVARSRKIFFSDPAVPGKFANMVPTFVFSLGAPLLNAVSMSTQLSAWLESPQKGLNQSGGLSIFWVAPTICFPLLRPIKLHWPASQTRWNQWARVEEKRPQRLRMLHCRVVKVSKKHCLVFSVRRSFVLCNLEAEACWRLKQKEGWNQVCERFRCQRRFQQLSRRYTRRFPLCSISNQVSWTQTQLHHAKTCFWPFAHFGPCCKLALAMLCLLEAKSVFFHILAGQLSSESPSQSSTW